MLNFQAMQLQPGRGKVLYNELLQENKQCVIRLIAKYTLMSLFDTIDPQEKSAMFVIDLTLFTSQHLKNSNQKKTLI